VDYFPTNSHTAELEAGRRQLSWRELLVLMRDHIGQIAGVTMLVVGLALSYLLLATPIYSADVLVRVDPPEPNALGIALQNQEALPLPAPSPSAEIAVIQSRSVLEPVIRHYRFDVSITPRSVPILGALAEKLATPGQPAAPWFGLRSYMWGGEQAQIASLEVPPVLEEEDLKLLVLDNGEYELRGPSNEHLLSGKVGQPASSNGVSILVRQLVARPETQFKVIRWNALDAATRLTDVLKIEDKVKDTGLVQITYSDKYPAKAAEVANAISRQYLASAVATRQRADSATLEFIKNELPRLHAELKRAEDELSAFEASSRSLQPTSEAQAYLQGGIDFDRQIATLQIQRTQLTERFTPDSRWVTNIDEQLKQLNAAKSAFDARFGSMPAFERKNIDLTRNAKVAETIYLGMVQKAEQLSVRRASTTGGAHIVDEAIRPLHPTKPNWVLVISGSVVLGLFTGAFLVFIRCHVMTGVTDPRYVERHLGVPVFGEVLFSQQQAELDHEMAAIALRSLPVHGDTVQMPRSRSSVQPRADGSSRIIHASGGTTKVLAERFPCDPSVEALRAVRTELVRDLSNAPNNIVMFTGPTSNAGKSFVAANLAVLHAEVGSRVLLIDADMRRGHLASFFGQHNQFGLSEILESEIPSSDAIRKVGVNGLSFISCGGRAQNPAALLMRYTFRKTLDSLSEQFDLVVVDTPPFLGVTDASIVASAAGATILVLRSGTQSELEIADTVRKLERSEARIVGAVFNAIPARRSTLSACYATYVRSANHVNAVT
jgi:tyrosine-protein kinase Etk/Wzc